MSDILGGGAWGQTPLDPDETQGLLLTYITSRGELDAAEQANIAKGRVWALRQRLTTSRILDDAFVRRLHLEMFGEVWGWAGTYRRTNKNIGIDWHGVQEAVRNLCGDAELWFKPAAAGLEQGTEVEPNPVEVAAVEFHRRLVLIHPFPNGNGRHARLTADLLVRTWGNVEFSWGGASGLIPSGVDDPVRAAYIAAMRAADRGDLGPLLKFARS